MKTILEFINKGHIIQSKKYIEPYSEKIIIDDLQDGDYFAIEWDVTGGSSPGHKRACGIYMSHKNYEKYADESTQESLKGVEDILFFCYCTVNARGEEKVFIDSKHIPYLGIRENILPVTINEAKKLDSLYKKYLDSKK